MFIIKDRKYPVLASKYALSEFSELINNTFDGGKQLFLVKEDRHIFIDLNEETYECYSINIILDAFNFININYNFKSYRDISLYYKDSDNLNRNLVCQDFDLKCYVDYKNKLILFGDIFATGECYQFFKDTFCVFSDNKVKLLLIRVEDDVLNYIHKNNLL